MALIPHIVTDAPATKYLTIKPVVMINESEAIKVSSPLYFFVSFRTLLIFAPHETKPHKIKKIILTLKILPFSAFVLFISTLKCCG